MNIVTRNKTLFLVRIAVFGALAFLVMLMEFYIGFTEYLKLDFSDIIAMIGGITMGPLAAVGIQLIKNLLKALLFSQTGGIGELANLFVGIAFVVPATLIYHHSRSNKNLLIGMIVGSFCMVTIACLANYFVLLPLYFGNSMDAGAKLIALKTIFIPFNIVKGIIVTFLTFIVHLSMKPLYRYFV